MTRIVPDTNIIISAIFWSGKPVTSPEIIDEVLTKMRFVTKAITKSSSVRLMGNLIS